MTYSGFFMWHNRNRMESGESSQEDTTIRRAAELFGAWLSDFGLKLVETVDVFSDARRTREMRITFAPSDKSMVKTQFVYGDGDVKTPDLSWNETANGVWKTRYSAWFFVLDRIFAPDSENKNRCSLRAVRVTRLVDAGVAGYEAIERTSYRIPKFQFRSLEEFVVKASVMKEFAS